MNYFLFGELFISGIVLFECIFMKFFDSNFDKCLMFNVKINLVVFRSWGRNLYVIFLCINIWGDFGNKL